MWGIWGSSIDTVNMEFCFQSFKLITNLDTNIQRSDDNHDNMMVIIAVICNCTLRDCQNDGDDNHSDMMVMYNFTLEKLM